MALDRRIVELYDEYTHKPLDRRVFMNRLLAIAGTTAAAEAALALLEPNYAHAQQVAPDDARITASRFDQTVDGVALKGYLVTPKAEAKRGGVLVIHENRGATRTSPSSASASTSPEIGHRHAGRRHRRGWDQRGFGRL